MPATIIDGKACALKRREQIGLQVQKLQAQGIQPALAVVVVGTHPASQVYVRNKRRACEKAGITSIAHDLPESTSEEELIALIEALNRDPSVHGILVQLPLPKHIAPQKVIALIDPQKDVDGFHPLNVGKLVLGEACLAPCTPSGIIELINESGFEIAGAHAVIVGRSNIVGKPIALMLLARNATVTICHSKTSDLAETVRGADILIAAIGKPCFIPGSWIKNGALVIDVGVNRLENGAIVGDVDFAQATEHAGAITPVPGGVGPMTITMLLTNTIKAAAFTAGR